MRIAYNNEWDNYEIYSATSEDSNYLVENTQNQILTTSWRSLSDSAQRIVIDAGAGNTITANSVFISGHNLTSGATIKFEMDDDPPNWVAPDLSETLTWRSSHIYKYFTSTSKRYMSFYFDDASNPDEYIEIGRLFAGVYLQITPSSLIPFTIGNIRNDVVQVTDQGAIYGSPGVARRIINLDFQYAPDSMIESIRTMYDTIGNYQTLYFMNYDSTFSHIDILYGRVTNQLEENIQGESKTHYSLTIEECL